MKVMHSDQDLPYSGVETHSSEQKTSLPVAEVHSSEQQTEFDSLAEIETAEIKETAIADHDETGESGISTHAPLLTECEHKGSPGTDVHLAFLDVESESYDSEQIKKVSAVEPVSTPDDLGCHMHEVHHTIDDGATLSLSGEQDTLQDKISSRTDVKPTCQRKKDFEGDKDHSTDLPTITLVMPEPDKDKCDAETVSANKLESSGGGDIGTVGFQEAAAAAAGHEGTRAIGTGVHGSEQMKMVSIAQAASNVSLLGYSSSEHSMLDDSARAADDGNFVDSKGAGVDGQGTTPTQTTSTLPDNTDIGWQGFPLRSGNDSPATCTVSVNSVKDTGNAGVASVGGRECGGTSCEKSGEVQMLLESSSLKLELPNKTDDFRGLNGEIGFDEHETRSQVQPDLPIKGGAEVSNTESTPGGANAKASGADYKQKLLPSSGESSSTDSSGNEENAKIKEADSAQGLLNTKPAHGSESIRLSEADTKPQLPPSSGEEAIADIYVEPHSHEVREATSSDPSRNNQNVETEKAAAAQELLNTKLDRGGKVDTGLQLAHSSGEETLVDKCGELPSQVVKEAPRSPSGHDEIIKMEYAAAPPQVLLNTKPAPVGENAKLGEANTEQELPLPSGKAKLPSQEVKEAPGIDLLGNDKYVKMEDAPAGLLNAEAAHGGENAKRSEVGIGLQLIPSSGESMVVISSEPLIQEVKEAASTSLSENDDSAEQ